MRCNDSYLSDELVNFYVGSGLVRLVSRLIEAGSAQSVALIILSVYLLRNRSRGQFGCDSSCF